MNVNYFIENNKIWNTCKLNDMLPKYIVNKIRDIPSPVNDIQDEVRNSPLMKNCHSKSYLGRYDQISLILELNY